MDTFRKKRTAALLTLAVLLVGVSLSLIVLSRTTDTRSRASTETTEPGFVRICHATGSTTNPYITMTVSDAAVDANGNENADHNSDTHQDGRDIIPPGTWDADGRNWTPENQNNWLNSCSLSVQPTTAVPSEIPVTLPPISVPPPVSISPDETITPTDTSPQPSVSESPTSSVPPTNATILLTVGLHGIGSSGDNMNPDENSLSNKDPRQKKRAVSVEVYADNSLVRTVTGEVQYDSLEGVYKGSVYQGDSAPAGAYSYRVKLGGFLGRKVHSLQSSIAGVIVLPKVTLVNGDVDNDNKLSIIDYSFIAECYAHHLPVSQCKDSNFTDLNDDGIIDLKDYNLFRREIRLLPGE